MTIIQHIKNLVTRLHLKTQLILKGELFTTTEAALAFNIKHVEKEIVSIKMH